MSYRMQQFTYLSWNSSVVLVRATMRWKCSIVSVCTRLIDVSVTRWVKWVTYLLMRNLMLWHLFVAWKLCSIASRLTLPDVFDYNRTGDTLKNSFSKALQQYIARIHNCWYYPSCLLYCFVNTSLSQSVILMRQLFYTYVDYICRRRRCMELNNLVVVLMWRLSDQISCNFFKSCS